MPFQVKVSEALGGPGPTQRGPWEQVHVTDPWEGGLSHP